VIDWESLALELLFLRDHAG